jgi:hypothetical protein
MAKKEEKKEEQLQLTKKQAARKAFLDKLRGLDKKR